MNILKVVLLFSICGLSSFSYSQSISIKYIDSLYINVLVEYSSRTALIEKRKEFYKEVTEYLSDHLESQFSKRVNSNQLSNNEIEFSMDTFKINQTFQILINLDERKAFVYKWDAEENLINKYYSKVLELLPDKDKALFIKSQKDWESSVTTDREFENKITSYEYTGGGSMWSYFTYIDLRHRSELLFQFYNHLK